LFNFHRLSTVAVSVFAAAFLASCGGASEGISDDSVFASDGIKSKAPHKAVDPEPDQVAAPSPAPDPAPVAEPASGWTYCASENEICNFSGTREVRYGLNGTYATRTASATVTCNNATFGDPLVGVQKNCEYANTTSSASAPAAPSTVPAPYGQDANAYRLTFSDEFQNGFNRSVWNDSIWYEASNPTTNYAVEDGKLKIWPQRDANGRFFNRTIDTDGKYYQTYGYFEIEAKLPYGRGTWPAFWLLNHDRQHPDRPEIDILEAYAGGGPNSGWSDANLKPTAYAATVWPRGIEGGPHAGSRTMQNLGDLSAGFHKYAVKWEPSRITFYFDGREVYTVNSSMNDRMYILLDLWYGSASGTPDDTTPTGKGNSFEVNYVRAWQFR
jgi:beta-glucanase (GH16 family)